MVGCNFRGYKCLWYNGEMGSYELLDFNPDELTKQKIRNKAWKLLQEKYGFTNKDKRKVMETSYLLDVDKLIRL